MSPRIAAALHRWHNFLALPRQSPRSWHAARLRDELRELAEAKTAVHQLSETADVFFTISRARHDGFAVGRLPPFVASRHGHIYAYMLAKYTFRWIFYLLLGRLCCRNGARVWVREVVNPAKDSKLDAVSARYDVDRERFMRVGRILRCTWPLLP